MAAIEWFRLWHDMPNDPKWRTVARVSGQSIATVLAVALHLMVDASRNVTRGHVSVTAEDVASALDVTDEAVEAIFSAMQGRVLDGDRLTGWEKRQPKREDLGNPETGVKSAAERKRAQREREKQAHGAAGNGGKSASHDESRDVTLDKDTDKDKETPTSPESESTTELVVSRATTDRSRALPSLAGEVCRQLREASVPSVNPSHPKLLALLEAGLTADEIVGIAREPQSAGKGFAWVLAAAEGRRRDAAAVRPLPVGPPAGARASPQRMTREDSRRIASSTRLSDFRAACAAEAPDDDRTIEATNPRLLG